MLKRDFKKAMQCGLGRCIVTLEKTNHMEKYNEIVLWGCLHNLSFDVQIEGTRGWYMYELMKRFPDKDYFLMPLIKKFTQIGSNGSGDFAHCCSILSCFASDGNQDVIQILWEKYNQLYLILKERKQLPKYKAFPIKDDFEYLCIELIENEGMETFLKIADDIGQLYFLRSIYSGADFDWLHYHSEQKFGKRRMEYQLRIKAKKSFATGIYLEKVYSLNSINEACHMQNNMDKPENIQQLYNVLKSGESVSRNVIQAIINCSSIDEVNQFASFAVSETDLSIKIKMLQAFFDERAPFPLSPEVLIQYAKSEDEELCMTAFCALEKVKHERVREFAYELLEQNHHMDEAIRLLTTNYCKKDKTVLITLIESIPINYRNASRWHSAFKAVQQMKKPPTELIIYMYENCQCSFCRESIVHRMSRYRILNPELVNELQFDSNEHIRNYAKKYSATHSLG